MAVCAECALFAVTACIVHSICCDSVCGLRAVRCDSMCGIRAVLCESMCGVRSVRCDSVRNAVLYLQSQKFVQGGNREAAAAFGDFPFAISGACFIVRAKGFYHQYRCVVTVSSVNAVCCARLRLSVTMPFAVRA